MKTADMECIEFVNKKGENIEGLTLRKDFPDERLPFKILCHPNAILSGCKTIQQEFRLPETELVQSEQVDPRFMVLHYGPPPTKEQIEKKLADRREREREAREAEAAAKKDAEEASKGKQ